MIITVTCNPAIDATVTLDTFVVGGCNRISSKRLDAGGKGINVSKMISVLNGKSIGTGFLGKDNASIFTSCFVQYGIQDQFQRIDGATRTNTKIVEKDGRLTELNESGFSISKEEQASFLHFIEQLLHQGDVLVVSGSLPKNVDPTYIKSMIEIGKQKECITILDVDGDSLRQGIEAQPYFIKPNVVELQKYFAYQQEPTEEECIELGKKLIQQGIHTVCISRGSEGSLLVQADSVYQASPTKVEVHSTVGAGDAMVGAFAYGYDNKLDEVESYRLAIACANGSVTTDGTNPPTKELIDTYQRSVELQKY